jgi:hypothetical protein
MRRDRMTFRTVQHEQCRALAAFGRSIGPRRASGPFGRRHPPKQFLDLDLSLQIERRLEQTLFGVLEARSSLAKTFMASVALRFRASATDPDHCTQAD